MSMTTYCARVESKVDFDLFLREMIEAKYSILGYTLVADLDLLKIEFECAATEEQLLQVLARVPDSHIFHRTLQVGAMKDCDLGEYVRTDR